MKGNAVKTRARPPVADRNRDAAYDNIRAKVSVLRLISTQIAKPHAVALTAAQRQLLALLPSTLRQFHLWSTDQLAGRAEAHWPVFSANAPATLRAAAASELKDSVVRVIDAVKMLQAGMNAPAKKEQSLASLRRELKVESAKLSISEQELKNSFAEIRGLKDKLLRLGAELESLRQKTIEMTRARQQERPPADKTRQRVVRLVREDKKGDK
jgi:hypothetical protein